MKLDNTLSGILTRPRAFRTSLITTTSPLRKKMVCLCSEQLLDRSPISKKIKENRKNNHDTPF